MLSQILLNTIISALHLSLIALGFNLILNTTKVFHIAHGAIYVFAVYSFYILNNLIQQVLPYGISTAVSAVSALVLVSILIIAIEYLVYRPLYQKKVNPTISLVSSLGVYLLIVNLITLALGNGNIALDNKFRIIFSNDYFKLTNIELIQMLISIVLITGVFLFARTRLYVNIRAITDNYMVAEKFGINIQRTRVVALIAGTILVSVAGIMKGYAIAIEPNAGLSIVLTASVAVIVGGSNSLKGTVIACFIIALIENYSVRFLSAHWKDILTYTLLISVLIFFRKGMVSVKQRIETR